MENLVISSLLDDLFYFTAMAFVGWILETLYRSLRQGHYVNAGFLSGPFVPIYGFGALFTAWVFEALHLVSPILRWSAVLLLPTVLEYVASWIMELIFGLKLWDYSGRFLNLKGRICLLFSLCWAGLIVILVLFIQPAVYAAIQSIPLYWQLYAAGALSAYFILDTQHSVRSVFNFKQYMEELKQHFSQGRSVLLPLEQGLRKHLPREIQQLLKPLSSFPSLLKVFRPHIANFPEWIKDRLEKRFGKDKERVQK